MLPSTRDRLAPRPAMLDAATSIVVVSGSRIFVWDGEGAPEEAKRTARMFADQVDELFFERRGKVVEVAVGEGGGDEEFKQVLSLEGVEGGEVSASRGIDVQR